VATQAASLFGFDILAQRRSPETTDFVDLLECDRVSERASARRLRDARFIATLGLDLSNLLPDEVRHKARTWREMPS
jgi:hypothetical protein